MAHVYDSFIPKLLHKFKYGPDAGLAPLVVDLIAKQYLAAPAQINCLVPVPLSRRRLWWRGFNQAQLVAAGLSQVWGILCQDLLQRTRQAARQATLNKSGRLSQDFGYEVKQGISLPSSVMLVDDVMTTGATLEACAKALKQAGVSQVFAVVLARGAAPPLQVEDLAGKDL